MNKFLQLNNIFSNLEKYSKLHKLKIKQVNDGLTLKDAVLFKFKTVEIDKTQVSAASDINFNKTKKKHYTQYYKKDKHM